MTELDDGWALLGERIGSNRGRDLSTRALLDREGRAPSAHGPLHADEPLLRAIFDNALDAILLADDQGRYVAANPAACTLFGLDRRALLGRSLSEFAASGFEVPEAWAQFLESGSLRGEFPSLRPDGTRLFLDYCAVANILPGLHLSILRDITQQREAAAALERAQRALEHAHKIEAVGRFASGVAHDFNNLLSVIMGFTELALDRLDAQNPLRAELEQVQLATTRGAELTAQLLGATRRRDAEPAVVDLNESVNAFEKICRRVLGAKVQLAVSTAPRRLPVYADPGQIEQVIMNLVVNARDAMPDGGVLTLDCCEVTREPESDSVRRRFVRLRVTDTGVGMDQATIARALEPFFTTKAVGAGTGLGLSIVHGIVKQAGGELSLQSEVGKGTTCELLLPLWDAVPADAEARPSQRPATGSETILLVEDDDGVRSVLRQVLQRRGYTVLEAPNGGEALLMCERYDSPIALLLVDIVLPWMSGRQLAERLAQLRPAMRVLYLSGHSEATVLGTDVPGSVQTLRKPVPGDVLARKVREVLDGVR